MVMGMGICQRQATPGSSQTAKLLDPKNMRSLMLRSFGACPPRPLRRDQALAAAPGSEHGDRRVVDGRRSAPSVLTHSNDAENARHRPDEDVQRLLALDINELVRHTSKVQRERQHHHMSSYFSLVSTYLEGTRESCAPCWSSHPSGRFKRWSSHNERCRCLASN